MWAILKDNYKSFDARKIIPVNDEVKIINKQISTLNLESNINSSNLSKPAILRDLPFDKIYHAARKEASGKKPVFFIHKYFARRITANYRMILLGLTLPYDSDIWEYFYKSFENGMKGSITVLDPFMGGGTTIFESLRLQCKTIGNDLQPLSNFITRALVSTVDEKEIKKHIKEFDSTIGKDIMKYYSTVCPNCGQKAEVMYNFHVKKVKTNSSCKEHKLYSGFVIALKKDVFTLVCPACNEVYKSDFENGFAKCKCGHVIYNPNHGYVEKGIFTCPKCKESKPLSGYTREDGYPLDTEIIAQEYYCPHCKSHDYKKVDEIDKVLYEEAVDEYERIKDILPIPYQKIPNGYNSNQLINHGYKYFSDLFNKRQLLTLGMLLKEINNIEDYNIKIWFQLAFSGMLETNNMLCRYQSTAYKIYNIFSNNMYVFTSMMVENNVWGTKFGTGNFTKTMGKILRGKKFNSNIYDIAVNESDKNHDSVIIESSEKVQAFPVRDFKKLDINKPVITCKDSRKLDHIPDKIVDVVLTDPSYGANVMYSDIIDFFHVWDYMSNIGPELGFSSPLSPKEEEIVVNCLQNQSYDDYTVGLTDVFKECFRVIKDDGYLIFSFHDRSIESWMSNLKSIYNSGFELIKSYPMQSESRIGTHTSNKNSIAFDIILICKKIYTTISEEVEKISEEKISNMIEKAYTNTDKILRRLFNVEAELTLSDVENIFISEFFSLCHDNNIHSNVLNEMIIRNIKDSIKNIDLYFDNYTITTVRNDWWTEL